MRHAIITGTVAALAFVFNGVIQAQDTAGQGTPEPEVTSRPWLGVTVDIRARDTDSLGAYIEAVRPGGPAEKAGLKPGDIITKVNGYTVSSVSDQQSPVVRLISLAARLEPNDTVPVELRRGKARKTVSLVTVPGTAFALQGLSQNSEGKWSFRIQADNAGTVDVERFFGWVTSPLAALETAPLNPELGQYFGTTEGVLVINCPSDSKLGLKGGDVILTVDGRKPSDPDHLMRMLQSGKPNEPTKLNVLRHGKRIGLKVRLDEQGKQ